MVLVVGAGLAAVRLRSGVVRDEPAKTPTET
jgi:hypothetical protein